MPRRRFSTATAGLGRTQQLVLRLLASNGACTARELAYHWPSLSEAAAEAAAVRLSERGFVDLADRDWQGARSYALTARGQRVEASLNLDDGEYLDEDEEEAR